MTDFVYFITSNKIGSQDPDLGGRLMYTFFLKLVQAVHLPSHILLMERGVLLLSESLCLDPIKVLEGRGVEILACQTCLDYYGIKERMGGREGIQYARYHRGDADGGKGYSPVGSFIASVS